MATFNIRDEALIFANQLRKLGLMQSYIAPGLGHYRNHYAVSVSERGL
ncbi:hypothetical protein [Sphingomonas sp. CFBP 8760]|nr:hypothetical protein [Sphingomonas sp. CFBP 8760]